MKQLSSHTRCISLRPYSPSPGERKRETLISLLQKMGKKNVASSDAGEREGKGSNVPAQHRTGEFHRRRLPKKKKPPRGEGKKKKKKKRACGRERNRLISVGATRILRFKKKKKLRGHGEGSLIPPGGKEGLVMSNKGRGEAGERGFSPQGVYQLSALREKRGVFL